MMMELYKDEVREDKMVNLKATNLQGEQIQKWCNGEAEDKNLIPHGYCGDPEKAFKLKTHCDDLYSHTANAIKELFKL